jgi:DNA gyrase subunit A
MSVIRHFEATPDERASYLKMRRAQEGVLDEPETDEDETVAVGELSQERFAEMSEAEDLILTITQGGSGKLSSSHDYPVRGRGGQGVKAMAGRNGALVACFPVERTDQVMLATSTGQSIRVPVEGSSVRSRAAGGVKVFNTGKGEFVVSVARVADQGDDEAETVVVAEAETGGAVE